ncbi:MAG: hypothetical protein KatS3mg131_2233 [Candidatus Tectimicrobiota bacterium]|nr:MAG: hypothetical protein KatS3mg131_2233 [Candidatus Tectomicrobia bacterium]
MTTYLVVSGGGAHGAFAVGALKALAAAGVRFDGVVGTSTGALIAPLVATGELDLLEEIYTSVRTRDILRWWPWNLLAVRAWYSTGPLEKLIARQLTPERYARLLASPTQVWLATVALQSGQVTYWNPRQGPGGQPLSLEVFRRALLASASQPVLMPLQAMPDGLQHADGGLREIAPLRKAIDEGAEAIWAVVLTPAAPSLRREPYRSVLAIAGRTLDLLLAEIVAGDVHTATTINAVLDWLEALRGRLAAHLAADELAALFADFPLAGKRLLELHLLRPEAELPGSSLRFDPGLMREMVAQGEAAARRYLARCGVV